jgi:uncharacterized protein
MRFKYAAFWLSAACVLVFIMQQIFGTDAFVLEKSLMWSQPWRILSSLFAHANAGHLVSNLVGLMLFGLLLEGRIGPKKVLLIFIAGGMLINIFTTYQSSLGASGAIYAIIGTLAVLRPLLVIWISYVPMPMAIAALFWLAQDIVRTIIPSNIGSLAHISGLGIGILVGIYLRLKGFGDSIKIRKRVHDPELEKQLDQWEKENMQR